MADRKIRKVRLEEARVDGKRLGRHIEHDPLSRNFPAETAAALADVVHARSIGPLDQDVPVELGSCTGNALVGAIATSPTVDHLAPDHPALDEKLAIQVYSAATRLDDFPGEYPPTDTGSSGNAVCKAARQLGLITSWRHAFGIDHALHALMLRAVITGVAWYEGFDQPDANGVVAIAGQIRGGHEFEVAEYHAAGAGDDPLDALVGCWNSWGTSFGKAGRFYMTVRTWGELLEAQGDVTVPIHSSRAARTSAGT